MCVCTIGDSRVGAVNFTTRRRVRESGVKYKKKEHARARTCIIRDRIGILWGEEVRRIPSSVRRAKAGSGTPGTRPPEQYVRSVIPDVYELLLLLYIYT